jgi:hypothetical protein
VMGTTTGQRELVEPDPEAPRHVGDMLEVAPDKWVAAGAVAAVERRGRPRSDHPSTREAASDSATTVQTIVYLTVTTPPSTASGPGGTHTMAWESPYPVEILVQTIAQLKRRREVREAPEP